MRRFLALGVLAASLLAAGVRAQGGRPPGSGAAPSGLIVGRVVDATSNAAIPGVIVSLTGTPLDSSIRVQTDAQGRFLFRNVPKGAFTLRAAIGGAVEGGGYLWSGGFGPQVGPYINGGYGQRRPGGLLQTIDLDDGEQIADAAITLWQGGSIDGTVYDASGEPLVDVSVAAPRRSADGRWLGGPAVRTDDRGAYHFGTLLPGDYVIVVTEVQGAMPAETHDSLAAAPNRPLNAVLANTAASAFTGGIDIGASLLGTTPWLNSSGLLPVPDDSGWRVYRTTFATSATTRSAAATVTVRPGEARTGIDVTMLPERPVSVSGTLVDDLGPIPNFGVRLFTREEPGVVPLDVGWTSTDAGGRFRFPLVPPGAYRLVAQRYATTRFGPDVVLPPAGPARAADRVGASAEQSVDVGDRDLTGLALRLRPGVPVTGQVEFRGARPPAAAIRQVLVFLTPSEPMSPAFPVRPHSAQLDARDGFVIRDVPPGRYALSVSDGPAGSLLDVWVDGKTVLERPIVIDDAPLTGVRIELTDRPAEIAGTVRTRAGAADPDAGVVLFPADRTRWPDVRTNARLFRSVRVSKAGAFSVRPVLPGEYYVAAVADDATGDFPDATFLDALASVATTVRVTAGGQHSLTLNAVESPRAPRAPSSGIDEPPAPAAHGPFVDDAPDDQSTAEPGVVVLTGVVTTDASPAQPLRQALVTVTGSGLRGPRQTVTDAEGRFAFRDLSPGRYAIVVEKPGYVKTYHGNARPGGMPATPVAVLAGQPAPHLTIPLPRGAVVAGTVRDQFGTPVSSARVVVKQSVVLNGARRVSDVPNLRAPVVNTDDQGRYRIYGLPPGEYVVFCSLPTANAAGVRATNSADVDAVLRELRAGRRVTSPPTPPRPVSLAGGYLPGVPDPESAEVIALGAGEVRMGADILLGPLRALTVTGTSLGPGGTPMRNIMIAVVNAATGTRVGSGGVIMPAADGRFVLSALPPGRYTLVGRAAENGAGETADMPWFAETEFVLTDENISGIVLAFERGITISGRIVPPATATPGAIANVRLGLTPVASYQSLVPGARVIATAQRDGTFRFDGVGPGQWRVTAPALPAGWSLDSAMLGGTDTLDIPIEVRPGQPAGDLIVTLTDQPTEISGTVIDAAGQPTADYSMIAFSTTHTLWTTAPRRISAVARVSSDGRYRIVGLPPGEYYLAALRNTDPQAPDDPSRLESLAASAMTITLAAGERTVRDCRIR